jgi:2-polyprenyl-3-methyl-5-hydroxy-6-metoxy-1,4-benzoquinol methylase
MAKEPTKHMDQELREKILEENRKVHAMESALYLARHPEQTNCYQDRLLHDMIEKVCGLLPGGAQSHILDLGCGTGYLYLPFLARGHHMQGVDLSAELICILEKMVPQNFKANSHLQVADVLEFAERDKTLYDAVVLSALLHHLFDYDQLIKTYCGKIKPGGVMLIFFEPLKQAIASPLRYALHKWLSRCEEIFYKIEMAIKGIPLFEEDYHLSDYQRQFGGIDPIRLMEVARNEGMEVLELKKYCARRYGASAFIANQILGTQNTFNLLLKKPG